MKTAVCPGSFDPITVGHLDLAERAAAIFDRVILCVMVNGEKHPMFSLAERLELARAAAAHLPNVEAAACGGLLADFAREHGACALVKGVRGSADFDWELQLAQINRDLNPQDPNTGTSAPPWCGKCSATSRICGPIFPQAR